MKAKALVSLGATFGKQDLLSSLGDELVLEHGSALLVYLVKLGVEGDLLLNLGSLHGTSVTEGKLVIQLGFSLLEESGTFEFFLEDGVLLEGTVDL